MKNIYCRMLLIVFVVPLISVALLTAGCSGESKGDKQPLVRAVKNESSVGVTAAAQMIGEGIIAGDSDTVTNQLSSKCRRKVSDDDVSSQLRSVQSYLTSFVGVKLSDISITSVETRDVVPAKTAQARYSITVGGNSRTIMEEELRRQYVATSTTNPDSVSSEDTFTFPYDEPTKWLSFVYEDMSWKLADCDDFIGAADNNR